MKKQYIEPEIEITELKQLPCVICTSCDQHWYWCDEDWGEE